MADVKVRLEFEPVEKILKDFGMDEKGDVQRYVTHRAKVRMEKYVPRRNGVLIETAVEHDTRIEYTQPYSAYQYFGKVMIGKKPKVATDKDLTYGGSPQRGSHWDVRMIADEGEHFEKEIQDYINKRR